MTIKSSQEVYSPILEDCLINNSTVTSNPLVIMVQITVPLKIIQALLHFSRITIHQSLWHLRYLRTSKLRHLEALVYISLNLPVRQISKIHIQWSLQTIHPGCLLFNTAKAASITHHRLTLIKTIEIITTEIRVKVTIKDHTLREGSQDDLTIVDSSSTSSKSSCKSWIWVKACKSRCRHIIRTPTTIMPSSQIWWTLRTFSIKIKVMLELLWEITMVSRSS